RERLAAIWTDPLSLDPARRSARVTRQIAERLAIVSKALEAQRHPPKEVAFFLMRCLFTMFAEDVGLLPEKSFKEVLGRCEQEPTTFENDVGQLWEAMDVGGCTLPREPMSSASWWRRSSSPYGPNGRKCWRQSSARRARSRLSAPTTHAVTISTRRRA